MTLLPQFHFGLFPIIFILFFRFLFFIFCLCLNSLKLHYTERSGESLRGAWGVRQKKSFDLTGKLQGRLFFITADNFVAAPPRGDSP